MSKVFKSIGKVFKKVVKVALKIAPYALAAAAVVFTGGAALGILPTFSAAVGGLVGSLGLSGAVAGALTGAVTSAGFGAALGFVTGGKKGLQKGALMGALTGGVLGMVNPSMFGIVKGATSAVSTAGEFSGSTLPTSAFANPVGQLATNPIATGAGGVAGEFTASSLPAALSTAIDKVPGTVTSSGQAVAQAGKGIAPLSQSPLSAPQPQFTASSLPTGTLSGGTDFSSTLGNFMDAGGPAQAATQGIQAIQQTTGGVGGIPASGGTGTGILDFINKNPSLVGSVLSSIGAGGSKVNSKDLQKQVDAQIQLQQREQALAYGGAYSGKPDPFGIGNTSYQVPQPRYYYDTKTNTVVDRQAQGA